MGAWRYSKTELPVVEDAGWGPTQALQQGMQTGKTQAGHAGTTAGDAEVAQADCADITHATNTDRLCRQQTQASYVGRTQAWKCRQGWKSSFSTVKTNIVKGRNTLVND